MHVTDRLAAFVLTATPDPASRSFLEVGAALASVAVAGRPAYPRLEILGDEGALLREAWSMAAIMDPLTAAAVLASRGTEVVADRCAAMVIGLEVAARLEAAVGEKAATRGFDPLGWQAAIVAAAAAARIHGLAQPVAAGALGMAASLGAGLALADADLRGLAVARGVEAGILAVALATAGFRGPSDGIGNARGGYLASIAGLSSGESIVADLGNVWVRDDSLRASPVVAPQAAAGVTRA